MKIIIKHRKKFFRQQLFFAICWFIFAIGMYFFSDKKILSVLYVLMSLVYFVIFLYSKKYQYLAIDNQYIYHRPFKKIALSEIKEIKYFAKTYTIETGTKMMNIRLNSMDDSSQNEFLYFIDKLKSKNI